MTHKPSKALDAIVGRDPELRALLARAVRLAPTSIPVLVTGESGTGKELLARVLHEHGRNPEGPLVAVNCGALPRELIESELFGHERGAFTGAGARRLGWFEEASGGTLVLDEVGELPLELQPRLLRVLETGRIRRVGGNGETTVAVRVVALTLRDLGREAREGRFRNDLFHRLTGVELCLPPLRKRPGDITLLARHFLDEIETEVGPRRIDPQAFAALMAYAWPGNVRELRNVMRRAALLTNALLDARSLELPIPPALASRAAEEEGPPYAGGPTCPDEPDDTLHLRGLTFEECRQQIYAFALRTHGSRRQAAAALGVGRSTFCEAVKRWGIG